MADSGVSLGKGAWDCDANEEIPPEKEVRHDHDATRRDVMRRTATLLGSQSEPRGSTAKCTARQHG